MNAARAWLLTILPCVIIILLICITVEWRDLRGPALLTTINDYVSGTLFKRDDEKKAGFARTPRRGKKEDATCANLLPSARQIVCRENFFETDRKGVNTLSYRQLKYVMMVNNLQVKPARRVPRRRDLLLRHLSTIREMRGAKAVLLDPGDATFPSDWDWLTSAFVESSVRVIFVRNANISAWMGAGGQVVVPGSWEHQRHVMHDDERAMTPGRKEEEKEAKGAVLVPIPIGLNFHTLGEAAMDSKWRWGERGGQSVVQQYKVLCAVRTSAAAAAAAAAAAPARGSNRSSSSFGGEGGGGGEEVRNRLLRVLAPFRAAPLGEDPLREGFFRRFGWPTRGHIWGALNGTGIADLAVGIHRRRMWELMGKYAIVASPPGHGLDCHRTWEALSLGCIVLVQASPLDGLFAHWQLPVVSLAGLDAWAALADPTRLQAIVDAYAPWTEPAHLVPRLSVKNLLNLASLRQSTSTKHQRVR